MVDVVVVVFVLCAVSVVVCRVFFAHHLVFLMESLADTLMRPLNSIVFNIHYAYPINTASSGCNIMHSAMRRRQTHAHTKCTIWKCFIKPNGIHGQRARDIFDSLRMSLIYLAFHSHSLLFFFFFLLFSVLFRSLPSVHFLTDAVP